MTETDGLRTERAERLKAAQAAYLASLPAQAARRDLVHEAVTLWRWPVRRVARVIGVEPGTVNAILAAARGTARLED